MPFLWEKFITSLILKVEGLEVETKKLDLEVETFCINTYSSRSWSIYV